MGLMSKRLLTIAFCGCAFLKLAAQCPDRPITGTVVNDAYSIPSQNGVLSAQLSMAHSVDANGYSHYCYNYSAGNQVIEAPTLRVSPGDTLLLDVLNRIQDSDGAMKSKIKSKMKMPMVDSPDTNCGDSGEMTVDSTNVHYHGMNVAPICHQDNVINTLIQPGTPGFKYKIPIPATQPPGLYWYHPHIHGFTEFQVNGGAAGALVVEGMEKIHPEVAGLTERIFLIRQQFLVPWIPGPYQLSINYQVSPITGGARPVIQMKPGDKEFWRVANATNQDFMPLQVIVNNQPQMLQLIALDGYPLAQTRMQDTIVLPPAGRAEFIVQAPPAGSNAFLFTQGYSTGPTGNPDLQQSLAAIQLSDNANFSRMPKAPESAAAKLRSADLAAQVPTAERKLFFSEEFAGTNGPIQFYITVEGQKQKVFEGNEKPVITTKVGAVEDWTIENRALETHAFHIHQIHFQVLEIDGKPAPNQDMRDTIDIPFWEGLGKPFHSVKVRMDFRDPTTAGMFVFHCHILLHEDLGMMHKILVEP